MESIQKLGLSVHDLVINFIISLVILLMTFVFIFISIDAFSSSTTFQSVTNSLLPVIAGGAVNKTGTKDVTDESGDYNQVVSSTLS